MGRQPGSPSITGGHDKPPVDRPHTAKARRVWMCTCVCLCECVFAFEEGGVTGGVGGAEEEEVTERARSTTALNLMGVHPADTHTYVCSSYLR